MDRSKSNRSFHFAATCPTARGNRDVVANKTSRDKFRSPYRRDAHGICDGRDTDRPRAPVFQCRKHRQDFRVPASAGGVRFALDFDLFARASGPVSASRAHTRCSMNSTLPPRWIVPILWILAAMDIVNGIEMFFFPAAWFFRLVPGVPETGPFNMHLAMDGEEKR